MFEPGQFPTTLEHSRHYHRRQLKFRARFFHKEVPVSYLMAFNILTKLHAPTNYEYLR